MPSKTETEPPEWFMVLLRRVTRVMLVALVVSALLIILVTVLMLTLF